MKEDAESWKTDRKGNAKEVCFIENEEIVFEGKGGWLRRHHRLRTPWGPMQAMTSVISHVRLKKKKNNKKKKIEGATFLIIQFFFERFWVLVFSIDICCQFQFMKLHCVDVYEIWGKCQHFSCKIRDHMESGDHTMEDHWCSCECSSDGAMNSQH